MLLVPSCTVRKAFLIISLPYICLRSLVILITLFGSFFTPLSRLSPSGYKVIISLNSQTIPWQLCTASIVRTTRPAHLRLLCQSELNSPAYTKTQHYISCTHYQAETGFSLHLGPQAQYANNLTAKHGHSGIYHSQHHTRISKYRIDGHFFLLSLKIIGITFFYYYLE